MSHYQGERSGAQIYKWNAKREVFNKYPGSVKELFRDKDFSYVISLQLHWVRVWIEERRVWTRAYDSAGANLSFDEVETELCVKPANSQLFKNEKEALDTLIEKVKEKMPEESLSMVFDKNSPEYRSTMKRYPLQTITDFFEDEDFQHITAIYVQGHRKYSTSRREVLNEWVRVEAYSVNGNGERRCEIRVLPPKKQGAFKGHVEAIIKFLETAYSTIQDKALKIEYYRGVPEEELNRYPPDMINFFKDKDFLYVKTICVKGCKRYDPEQMKCVQVWQSVEAYGSRQNKRTVYTTKRNQIEKPWSLDDALRNFFRGADQTERWRYYDRNDKETYEGERVEDFFKNPNFKDIQCIDVFYKNSIGGYVAYAYTRNSNEPVIGVEKVWDGRHHVPFRAPKDALAGLLKQPDKERSTMHPHKKATRRRYR